MFFALTEEQCALRDAVTTLLANRFPPSIVRRIYDEEEDTDSGWTTIWRALAELGALSVLIPEEFDGLGLNVLDGAVVARCLGAGIIPGPYLPTLIAAEAIRLAGSPQQRATWLPQVSSGRVVLALAFGQVGGGWDAAGLGFRADRNILRGAVSHSEYADVAEVIVVGARGDTDVCLFLVDRTDPGVIISPAEALDRTTRFATVTLNSVRAEPLPGGSHEVFSSIVDLGAVLYANDLVGLAREALARTVQYALARIQFGQPIGSFQAVKHALADLHVAVNMAEHLSLYAAHAIDEDLSNTRLAVSAAKAKASDVARLATFEMVQSHGAIACTWDHEAHVYIRRAKRGEYAFGDTIWHRERIGEILIKT